MAKILLVDDELELSKIVSEFIKDNFEVEIDICSDGTGAQFMLDTHTYDLMITDIRMKNLGGIGLLKMIKAGMIKNRPDHIWVISAFISKEQGNMLEQSNVVFLEKPINYDYLKEKLSEIFF
jgi:CheY-like chemotaxis protein